MNLAPHIDRLLMRLSHERFSTAAGLPTLMLTTIGAKSGQPRSTPLIYLLDGDRVVLVASRGGDTRHPGWYYNLHANPQATLLTLGCASLIAYFSVVQYLRRIQTNERIILETRGCL